MKKYTISILTYKAFPLVKACVESVLKHSNMAEVKLVLTDNGAGKECSDYFDTMAARHEGIIFAKHYAENQGFIIPNNAVFEECDTEFLVLLNDDVEMLTPNWLDILESPFRQYPNAALSGPRGGCQTLTEEFNGRPQGPFEYLEGSVLMIKVGRVRPEKLFSDYLTHSYGEDSDLSLRMRQKGFTLHQLDLKFIHVRAQTSRHIPEIKQIQAKNHVALRKRWNHYIRIRKFEYPIVVRRMAARGDVLLITPVLKQLALENPLSTIHVETAFPEIFAGNPHVKSASSSVQRGFDTRYINLDMVYEQRVKTHIVQAYADAAGVKLPEKIITEIYFSPEDRAFAKAQLPKDKWCAVHAGPTTWAGKNWPIERWVELTRKIQSTLKYKVVLIGHGETSMIPCDRDLRGMTQVGQTAAVLKECKLFIGLDSFPMHIAQAVGCPTIGLFGVTLPEYIMTDGSYHRGVVGDRSIAETGSRHDVPGRVIVASNGESMRSITVAQVIDEASEIYFGKHHRIANLV